MLTYNFLRSTIKPYLQVTFQLRCSVIDKKNLIIGTTMVKGFRMKELNRCLTNSFAKLRSFPGAKNKQFSYYAVPSLVGETPNRILIYKE